MRLKFLTFFVFLFFSGCDMFLRSSKTTENLTVFTDILETVEAKIFFTKDLKGFIDICGCSEDMAGGLPRIASLKNKYENSIWIDLGNWAHEESHNDPVPEVTEEIIYKFFHDYMDYEIVIDEFINNDKNEVKTKDVSFGSENNQNEAKFTYLPDQDDFCLDYEGAFKRLEDFFVVSEDIHVVISNCSIEANRLIAEYIYEESEYLGFFSTYLIAESNEDRGNLSKVWAPPILPFGQEVGALSLPSMDFERIYMGSKWKDDNSVVEMIASVREKGFRDKVPTNKKESLNSEFCMNCHQDSYDVWKDSKHAHAWNTLVDRDMTLRPDCVGCHVTNWNYEDLSYSYVNVGCVVCHQGDPIQHSIKPSKNTLVASFDTCYSCHRPDHSTLFSVKGYWPQIEHP